MVLIKFGMLLIQKVNFILNFVFEKFINLLKNLYKDDFKKLWVPIEILKGYFLNKLIRKLY